MTSKRRPEGIVLVSDWKDLDSVTVIGQGLRERYTALGDSLALRLVEVRDHSRRAPLCHDYAEFFEESYLFPPKTVVVTNGAILRSYFFRLLLMVLRTKGCSYYFHIYGDYLRQVDLWLSLESILQGQRVRFIAPSSAYQSVIRKTLQDPDLVAAVPFSHSPEALGRSGEEFPHSGRPLRFLYSGRISTQKNVASAVRLLEGLQHKLGRPIELLLAGGLDDFEPFSSGVQTLGTQFTKLARPASIRVVRLGHLPRGRLAPIYAGADFFVSLSTFHDDDFCLAAVEALSAGLPAILSRWGGHLDLLDRFSDRTFGIPLSDSGAVLGESAALEGLRAFVTSPPKKHEAQAFQEYFSPVRIARLLEAQLDVPPPLFSGFSPIFGAWARELSAGVRGPASAELYESFQGRTDGLD